MADQIEPYGCRYCGLPKRGHARRWSKDEGWHSWTAPEQETVKPRIVARREAKHAQELAALRARAEKAEALIANVRRLCDMTIASSCRIQAINQAEDTLAILDNRVSGHLAALEASRD